MRRFWLACTMVIVVGISSCVDSDKDLYQEAPGVEINTSNFSTIQKVQVEIDCSNSESRVPFSIYDGNPLIEGENTIILKENVQALDGAWTDEQGKFTATVELPAYVSNVYIVSTSPFARQAIPGKIVNGVLKVSDTDEQFTTRASYRESTRFDRNRFNNLGWNTNLGSFDDRSGVIDYAYKGNGKMRMEALVRFMTLRSLATKGKIAQAVDFIKTFLDSGKKLIVFCSLHEIVDELQRVFPKAVTVTGRDSAINKQASVDAFQNNPNVQLIICSIKAAGVGLTLTASSNVAFIELAWTYADCCQCEDRAHRIGQKDNVTCYYLLGRGTIDHTIYSLIHRKKSIASEIMNSDDDIPTDEMYFNELVKSFLTASG